MPAVPITSEPGLALHRALAREVARLRVHDPLTTITVVVPSRRAGLAARRLLGAAAPVGIANVSFITPRWLAELVAGPALAAEGRRPLTPAVAREALRAELLASPGPLGATAASPLTIGTLAGTFERLRTLPSEAPLLGDTSWLTRLFAATQRRLSSYYDGTALLDALRTAVRDQPAALAALGTIVAWCPQRGDLFGSQLLGTLGEAVTVIEAQAPAQAAPTEVVITTDPDEEIRAVVRRLLRWAGEGIAWHRMAIAYPSEHPYAAIVHQQLAAAGIAHNGPTPHRLGTTPPGRLITGLLALAGTSLPRPAMMAWLTSAPVIDPVSESRRRVPASWWELLSRRAGVVEGAEQWSTRLAHLGDPANTDSHLHLSDRQRTEAAALAAFVADLDTALALPSPGARWAQWAGWARKLFHRFGGTPRRGRALRPAAGAAEATATADAADAILAALDELSGLDHVGVVPTLEAFRHALGELLQAPFGRLGEFGTGVFVVPLHEVPTLPLEAVAVVGAVEGSLPRRRHVDAVLNPALATALEAWLAGPEEQLEQQRRNFVLSVDAGTRHRLVSLPRAELHSNRHHLPSRWLLDATRALTGTRLRAGELLAAGATGAPIHLVASYRAGLAEQPAGSTQERRVGALAAGGSSVAEDEQVFAHPAALAHPGLWRGIQAVTQRAAGELGPFTGAVDAALVPSFDPSHPMSPTALEQDAACPRRYLFGRMLGIDDIDRPEDIIDLTPLERGNLVHAILETYVRGLLADPPLDRSLDRLLEVADAVFGEFEARGVTGRVLSWAGARRTVRRDLVAFHRRDALTPLAVELPFGMDDAPAVEVVLPDGLELAFRGRIDRVDRATTGHLVVTDYKTGSDARYRAIETDTVDGGTRLQLPIYALAAAAAFPSAPPPISAQYWFVNAAARYRTRGFAVDENRLATFHTTVGGLARQIIGGLFPGRPERPKQGRAPEWNCNICPFDRICPADRATEWASVRLDPRLAPFVALSAGEDE